MQLSRIERKYWEPVTFSDGTEGAICHDGLLYMFDNTQDIRDRITEKFPVKNKRVWYFNASKDRECAEVKCERITMNPSAVVDVFGMPNGYGSNNG
jgi:hypothetical protein